MSVAGMNAAAMDPDLSNPDDPQVVLPPGPRCIQCGHVPCPCCNEWCDYIDEDGEHCCDGRCTYEPGHLREWHRQIVPLLTAAPECVSVMVADGPFWPGEARS